MNFGKKVASIIFKQRILILILILAATAFFGYSLKDLKVYTSFSDLLPQKHPFIQTYNEINEKFGGANFLIISLEVKEGDIFNPVTLGKIRAVTEKVDQIEGVNHYQVESIAHRKVRSLTVTAMGTLRSDLIVPVGDIPSTPEALQEIKDAVHSTEYIYGRLVSMDDKAALISVGFFEGKLDYKKVFAEVRKIVLEEEDENNKISVAGQPMLTGWIFQYQHEMFYIFAITALVMALLLFYYFRNLIGIIIPFIAAGISGVWGLGFASLMGFNIDPLVLVIPLLISARAISHSVQLTERFQEVYEEVKEVGSSAKMAMEELFTPGFIGIVTDAAGVFVIATATVRQMRIMALYCSFWVITLIISVLVLVPILLSLFPFKMRAKVKRGLLDKMLEGISRYAIGRKSRWVIVAAAVLIAVIGLGVGPFLQVGDIHPGSPLLWPDSPYNQSAARINAKFPGADKLTVFIHGPENPDYVNSPEKCYLRDPDVLMNVQAFQKYMEQDPNCGGSVALPDVIKGVNKVFHYNDPKWYLVPSNSVDVGNYIFMYMAGSAVPGSLAEYTDYKLQDGSITFFYKDHINKTVDNAIKRAKEFIAHKSEGVTYMLAGGNIGVLAATNEEIERVNWITLVLVFIIVFVFITFFYRSFGAGILIFISLALANFVALIYMVFQQIGLDINTLPVACVGVGVGVDYAVYIIDRMKVEHQKGLPLIPAIQKAILTTGRAVTFTATTLVGGIISWYFLSSIRFQAEMSILLSILMVVNMFGAIILIPTLFGIVKPKLLRAKSE